MTKIKVIVVLRMFLCRFRQSTEMKNVGGKEVEKPWANTLSPASCCSLAMSCHWCCDKGGDRAQTRSCKLFSTLAHPTQMKRDFFSFIWKGKCSIRDSQYEKKKEKKHFLSDHLIHFSLLRIRGQFHQRSTSSFYACRSQKRKKDDWLDSLFCAFGIWERKSCS